MKLLITQTDTDLAIHKSDGGRHSSFFFDDSFQRLGYSKNKQLQVYCTSFLLEVPWIR